MVAVFLSQAITIIFLLQSGCTILVVEEDKRSKYEEYIVEHEISSGQAKNSVLSTDIDSIIAPPGCQECTQKEIKYCLESALINDHCCCDQRHHEFLPFIPHTCYLGKQLCKTIAHDCTEYHRLRICCCLKHAFVKWRAKSDSQRPLQGNITAFLLICLFIYRLLY